MPTTAVEVQLPAGIQAMSVSQEEQEAARSILDIRRQATEISLELKRSQECLKSKSDCVNSSSRIPRGTVKKIARDGNDGGKRSLSDAARHKTIVSKSTTKQRIMVISSPDSDDDVIECLD